MQRSFLWPPPCPSCQPRLRSVRRSAAEPRCPAVAFAFPYLPMRGRFRLHVLLRSLWAPGLDCRSRNLLHYFPRKGLAQPVLQCFLENDGVPRDFHHVTVEHRVVFPQKISFIHAVTNHRDETAFGAHHTSQVDGPDFQTLLARAAARTARVAHHRTDERIPSPVRGVFAVRGELPLARRVLTRSAFRSAIAGCWQVFFRRRSGRWLRALPG